MGANDAATEGTWRWVTRACEAGTQFWSGAANGSSVGGQYSHWNLGEPNGIISVEDYVSFRIDGTWNDFPNSVSRTDIQGYVVEYGGTGFGSLQTAPLVVTVNAVNDDLTLNNLNGDTATTTVNQTVLIDTGTAVTITDVDATNFNGSTLWSSLLRLALPTAASRWMASIQLQVVIILFRQVKPLPSVQQLLIPYMRPMMVNWAALSNQEFVTSLSEVVLGQPLTGDNLNYWVNQLDQNLSQRSDLFVIAANNTEYQDTLFGNEGLILL